MNQDQGTSSQPGSDRDQTDTAHRSPWGTDQVRLADSNDHHAQRWERFWHAGPELAEVLFSMAPPETPLEVLERLGPSPFEGGRFPLIGFLATTYDKVSLFALAGP